MSNENRKRKITTFTLDNETIKWLDVLSAFNGKSKSKIIDMLVLNEINNNTKIKDFEKTLMVNREKFNS